MTKITPDQLRNAVQFVACDHAPLCHGFRWRIQDEQALAQLVAWILEGYYHHAARILAQLDSTRPIVPATIKTQAISVISLPPKTGDVAARWHRDGLVFQHISWLAALASAPKSIASSIPHLRPAHKGFDALLVPLKNKTTALEGIIICEDKATTNPRNQITQNVWPEIATIEGGERDAELNGELVAILRNHGIQNLEQIISAAHWLNRKSYRVSITVGDTHEDNDVRRKLFDGFDVCAPGKDNARRRAETLTLTNMRVWMDAFCKKVVAAIKGN
jgi:hypothetical protein